MSEINSQALREAAEQAMHDDWGFDADLFHELVTPSIVLELLDERERNQQYIKRRDQENVRFNHDFEPVNKADADRIAEEIETAEHIKKLRAIRRK
ncbi:Ea22 protein [Escherichia phage D2]|nr:Ea22 protein [Escherichia phage D2]